MGNMYGDSIKQWNVIIGCSFDCVYCKRSFQAQMKRQLHNCLQCYNYEIHIHEDRLKQSLPKTEGDQFIWACSSCDISFAKHEWIQKVLDTMTLEKHKNKTFFMQSKDPQIFQQFDLPENLMIGITLETNRDTSKYSKAPGPKQRSSDFYGVKHRPKVITIEPIMDFDMDLFKKMIHDIYPDRIYIGYDTKKSRLVEPSLMKTRELIEWLEEFTIVKTKLMREGNVCQKS